VDGGPAVREHAGSRIALGSDERTELTDAVSRMLEERGHEVIQVGPVSARAEEHDKQWAQVGREVGELVATGDCATAVLFCWTGTGASIAANKVRGVRAALCTDVETTAGARTWNDANVLVMSLRLVSIPLAAVMLDAWLSTDPDPAENENIALLDGPD
jgi:ribose 5-phosphate isomerase B